MLSRPQRAPAAGACSTGAHVAVRLRVHVLAAMMHQDMLPETIASKNTPCPHLAHGVHGMPSWSAALPAAGCSQHKHMRVHVPGDLLLPGLLLPGGRITTCPDTIWLTVASLADATSSLYVRRRASSSAAVRARYSSSIVLNSGGRPAGQDRKKRERDACACQHKGAQCRTRCQETSDSEISAAVGVAR